MRVLLWGYELGFSSSQMEFNFSIVNGISIEGFCTSIVVVARHSRGLILLSKDANQLSVDDPVISL